MFLSKTSTLRGTTSLLTRPENNYLYLIKISRGKYCLVHVRFKTARTGIRTNSKGVTSFEKICTCVHEELNGFLQRPSAYTFKYFFLSPRSDECCISGRENYDTAFPSLWHNLTPALKNPGYAYDVLSLLAEKRGNDRRSQICMYNEQQLVILHPLYVPHLR